MNTSKRGFQIGVMFRRENAPETLPEYVRRTEQAGFDEVWIVEDCFYGSGIASVAVALATTEKIAVGLGIMPAVARNPAFAAMEIATLARLYPGRFLPGFGHGVADWMRQIGAFPQSQLAAIEEVTQVTRLLLRGEKVTFHGQHVQLDQVQLEFPPQQVPPIVLGVRGPKSMEVVGRSADGVLLAECSASAYVARARELMQTSHRQAGRTDRQRMNVYEYCAVDDDPNAARQRLRPLTARTLPYIQAHLEPLGILPEVSAMLANGGVERLEQEMPDAWLNQLHIVGTPSDCAAAIRTLAAAGADSVILVPVDDPGADGVEPLARKLLPLLN